VKTARDVPNVEIGPQLDSSNSRTS